MFAPGLRRRRHELASTRLLRLNGHASGLELISLVATPPPELPAPVTESAAEPVEGLLEGEPTTPPNVWDPWSLPTARNYTVIVLANVSWGSRQQRPHHVARAFAAHGHDVFYVSIGDGPLGEENVVDEGVVEVEFRPARRYNHYSDIPDRELVDEWMIAVEALKLRHHIEDAAVHVHLQSWTPLAWALRDAHGWRIVYDCMDEWEDFPGMGRALVEIERELVEGADLVVTTAEGLRQKWAPHNPHTALVRNAVDAAFFTNNCRPSELLIQAQHPVIGFTGGLAGWLDFELVAAVARARPDWTFVLVGDVHVEVDSLRGLDRMDNVVLTGLQPYASMPSYLFSFDVAIIPFVVDRITEAVDPVKFYEYAASGTPIVVTCLPELVDHRHLFHEGLDPSTFEQAIERALAEDPALRNERIALAESNTWHDRYEAFDRETRALWPTLSIVVVTYGQLAYTRRCLDTLLTNTSYPALEVIVVDNGSSDGTPMYLRRLSEHDPRVTVLLNADNRGFAAANNQGLAVATGEVLVLLNNDTEVPPGWHVPLLQHLEDPTIGLVGPRSDNVGNGARIEVPPSYADDRDGFARRLRLDHEGEAFDIHMLGMFCVAMRRDVYSTVGPLDEGYGVGLFEDDDYAERIREAGWRVVCARDAFVHHVGQVTFRSLMDTGEYQELWKQNLGRFESRWGHWRADQNLVERSVSD